MNDRAPEPPLESFDPSVELSPQGKALIEGFALKIAERWATPQNSDALSGDAIYTPEFLGGLTTLSVTNKELASVSAPTEVYEVNFLVQELAGYFEQGMPVPDYSVLRDAFLYVGLHHTLFASAHGRDLLLPLRRAFWNHYIENFNEIHDLIDTGSASAMAFFTICGILIPQDNKTSGLTVARFDKGKKQLKIELDKLDPIKKERDRVRNLLHFDGTFETLQRVKFPMGAVRELASLAESLLICASQLKKESHLVSLRSCKTFRDLIRALRDVVDHPKDPVSAEDYAYAVRALRLLTVAGVYITDAGEVILQDSTSLSD